MGAIPYVDPKRYDKEKGEDALQKLKFDVFSIGVLFWELSSGHRPFENRDYDLHLAMDIAQGLREVPVIDTLDDYIKLYIGKLIKFINYKHYYYNFNFIKILYFRMLGR